MLDKINFQNTLKDYSKVFRPTTFEHHLMEKIFLEFIKDEIPKNSELYVHRQSDTLICYQGHPKLAFIVHGDLPLFLEGDNGTIQTTSTDSPNFLRDSKGTTIEWSQNVVAQKKFKNFPYQGLQDVQFQNNEILGYQIGNLVHLALLLNFVKNAMNFAFAVTQNYHQGGRGTLIASQFLENIPSVQLLMGLECMENQFYGKGPCLGVKIRPQEKALNQINPGNKWNLDSSHASHHGKLLDGVGVFKDWVCGGLSVQNLGTSHEKVHEKDVEKLYDLITDLSQWKS